MLRFVNFLVLLATLEFGRVKSADIEVTKGRKMGVGEIPKTPREVLRFFYQHPNTTVLQLEEANFKMAVDNYRAVIMLFYTSNSELCETLMSKFITASKIVRERSQIQFPTDESSRDEVVFAAIDINKKRVIGEHFNITAVPKIRVFPRKDTVGYPLDIYLGSYNEDSRTTSALVQYAALLGNFPLMILEDERNLYQLKRDWFRHENIDSLVIGFFDPPKKDNAEPSAEMKNFIEVAYAHGKNNTFAVTNNQTMTEKFNVKAPAIIILKYFDDKRVVVDAEQMKDRETMEQIVISNTIPTFVKADVRAQPANIFHKGFKDYAVLIDKPGRPGHEQTLESFKKVCGETRKDSKNPKQCIFNEADQKMMSVGFPARYQMSSTDLPILAIIHQEPEDRDKRQFTAVYKNEKVADDNIAQVLEQYDAKKLSPYIRSQNLPFDKDQLFNVISGNKFDEVQKEWAKKAILIRILESEIHSVCYDTSKAPRGVCSVDSKESDASFSSHLAQLEPLKAQCGFVQIDSRHNDISHFIPQLAKTLGSTEDIISTVRKDGPMLVLLHADRNKEPAVFGDDATNFDSVAKFLNEHVAVDTGDDNDEL